MGWLVRYSTYSTYSKELGESGCSVGCLVRYSTYRSCGCWATRARVFLERDGGTHQCELIMINNEALVQTKSLLFLTTNQRNPGCLVIAGNTGNVVCNTSFTDLSDSRVKTEMRPTWQSSCSSLTPWSQAVQAPGHERRPKAGLRLGRLRRNEVEEFDGDHAVERRRGDGHPHLTSVLWGVCKGFQARLDALEAGRPSGGQRTSSSGLHPGNLA